MPVLVCYASGPRGDLQLRVRLKSQRVAVPVGDMPWPEPPRRLLLICPGLVVEQRYVNTTHGYAAYYVGAAEFDALLDLIRRHCFVEPCRLPCAVVEVK
jgi:hypothetical protein